MPATPEAQNTGGPEGGPDLKIQMPQLPKQLEGKYVRGQMYMYQDSLPKQPVPRLEQTLKKYTNGIQHLVSREEFERTKKIVAEFGRPGGVGEELQKKLLQKAENTENWLLNWWNIAAYLTNNQPLPVYSNVASGFTTKASGDIESYAKLAAKFLIIDVQYNMLVENHALPPDIYRGTPLCMAQFDLHSKCRIPCGGTEVLIKTPLQQSRHIIIARNGHFYKLDMLYQCPDGSFALAPPTHIVKEVLTILETAPDTCEHPVGVLTAENRDSWYETRKKLLLDPVNKASLEAIETAQSVLNLDRSFSADSKEAHPDLKYWDEFKTSSANTALYGGVQNCRNRWFDFCSQFNLGEDGIGGGNLEHCAADGICGISLLPFLLQMLEMCDVLTDTSPIPESSLQPFQPLQWNISQPVARDIQVAKEKLDKIVRDVDMHVFTFDEFGKDFPKSLKLPPDGLLQNAILLTYYRIHGSIAPMCESASTRMFKLGRTDFIRNTTSEAMAFIKTMHNPSASNLAKAMTLLAAIKAHSQVAMEAVQGQAFDRHMLGLKMAANESDMDLPEVFSDHTFDKTRRFKIFASQVPVPSALCLCFGARDPDGYGICYNPQDHQITICVSCYKSSPDTDSILFLKTLAQTLIELRGILIGVCDQIIS